MVAFFLEQLNVQKSPNVFLYNHENKVNKPYKPSTEDTDDSCYNFAFLESCNNSANPCCEWDDCKNEAHYIAQTKII